MRHAPHGEPAHRQPAGDQSPSSEPIGQRTEQRAHRQRDDGLQRDERANLRRAEAHDLLRVERQKTAEGAVEQELAGLREADRQDPGVGRHFPHALSHARPERVNGMRRSVGRPSRDEPERAKPQQSADRERGSIPARREQVPDQQRTDGLARALERRVDAQPHAASIRRRQIGDGRRGDRSEDSRGRPVREAQDDERRQRRRSEVAERQQREHDARAEQQPPASERVGQRAGRQLHDDTGERGGADDEPDERRAGAKIARQQRQQGRPAHLIAAVRARAGGAQPRERSDRSICRHTKSGCHTVYSQSKLGRIPCASFARSLRSSRS